MTLAAQKHPLYVVVAPGLETLAARELEALGITGIQVGKGGLSLRGTLEVAAKANLWLRTASRVVVRVGVFDAPGRRELAARARRFDWSPWFAPGSPLRIHVTCQSSRLYHTGLVAEVLHEATDTKPSSDDDAPMLLARIVKDRCTLSFDTSGELLHKRGARQEISRAPLRETIAAGLLLACEYDGTLPFVDPMCGSGSLVLEAASIATGRAPGLERPFALDRFPSFDPQLMERLRDDARQQIRRAPAPIIGSDLHAGALAQAGRNAVRAGVAEDLVLERANAATRSAPETAGLVAVNPPWGKRVEADPATMEALRVSLSTTFRQWRRALVAPDALLRTLMRRPPDGAISLNDGGIRVQLAQWAGDGT